MSEPDDLSHDEEQVRRLLADARHTEPVPADVAARLDAVLAGLHHADPANPDPAVRAPRPPADLDAARRRRNVRTWLVAAAAVVVVGVGIDQLAQVDLTGHDADGGSSADSAVARERSSDDSDAVSGSASSGDGAGAGSGDVPAPEMGAARVRPVRLDSQRFGAQVTRLQRRSDFTRLTDDLSSGLVGGFDADVDGAYATTCPATGWGRGVVVPARYDGDPGALVFRRVRGDTQVVDLFLCGATHPARSITLPAP